VGLHYANGDVLPLPRESSVIGKVLEVTLKAYLWKRLLTVTNLHVLDASSDRMYPDFSFSGSMIQPYIFALDVKCARMTKDAKKTQSSISIGTFDAEYFRYPEDKVANIMAPYSSYCAHLCLVALYRYEDGKPRDIELLVVEKWRVATKKKSSGTRCYIGAPRSIAALRAEQGSFESEEEFNSFWRAESISFEKQQRWKTRREPRAGKPRRRTAALPLFGE
jgi:hypothetical protein